jgi:protein-L-isoaspartate(D-aspartate) O-methyltransferase
VWADARGAMVDAIARSGGVTSQEVLRALGRVQREAFVPRFWSLPPNMAQGRSVDEREWRVDDPATAAATAALVYNMDRALAIRPRAATNGSTGLPGITSTASAPRLMGSMLEMLELTPGTTVLEIGTGSGYNAALLVELVGDPDLVTSVDIDASLVRDAAESLRATGYDGVHLVVGDGYGGVPDGAPFDRVVATVGCVDLAPAWLAELDPGGFCLVPLLHGGMHPLMRAEPTARGATGRVVGRSGFVPIQGYQAGRSPWAHSARRIFNPAVIWQPLSRELTRALQPEPGHADVDGRGIWDLDYFIALEEPRSALLASLDDGRGSMAAIDPATGRIGWTGEAGLELRSRLLQLARGWLEMGRPGADEYRSDFVEMVGESGVRVDGEPWLIDRVDYRQAVRLPA